MYPYKDPEQPVDELAEEQSAMFDHESEFEFGAEIDWETIPF